MNVGSGVEGEEVNEGRCGTCKHAAEVVTKESKYATGFVRCAFRKRSEWLSPRESCQRYERRADQREGAQEGAGNGA